MDPAGNLIWPILLWTAWSILLMTGCTQAPEPVAVGTPADNQDELMAPAADDHESTDDRSTERRRMVATQLARRDIVSPRVLSAMQRVPRHKFVPSDRQDMAYNDSPLPIGDGQTISQPYIVALMTQLADPQDHHRALDVGTGSGYQAAILAELAEHVFSIEIVEPLARDAGSRLREQGYNNVTVRHGDGYHGWPEEAPFDVIIVAAAPDHVPQALVDQLAPGGRMILPVGEGYQQLVMVGKRPDGTVEQSEIIPVAFVPMTGDARRSLDTER